MPQGAPIARANLRERLETSKMILPSPEYAFLVICCRSCLEMHEPL